MKHFIVALFLSIPCCVFAQISVDKVEENGNRIIITDYSSLYTGWTNAASFRLGYIHFEDVELYNLSLLLNEGKMQIEEGRKLLLKFSDGSTMELSNSKQIGPADYEYRTSKYGTTYLVCPSYKISEDEIKRIIEGEVVKIRIENNIEFFDRDIKKNKLSKGLKNAYNAIQKKKLTNNGLYDGF